MRGFGWGYRKGLRVATKITSTHIVEVSEMVNVLAAWSEAHRDDFDMSDFLTRTQVEQIIRRAYLDRGSVAGSADWARGRDDIAIRRAVRFAQRQLRFAFPVEYQLSRQDGWL